MRNIGPGREGGRAGGRRGRWGGGLRVSATKRVHRPSTEKGGPGAFLAPKLLRPKGLSNGKRGDPHTLPTSSNPTYCTVVDGGDRWGRKETDGGALTKLRPSPPSPSSRGTQGSGGVGKEVRMQTGRGTPPPRGERVLAGPTRPPGPWKGPVGEAQREGGQAAIGERHRSGDGLSGAGGGEGGRAAEESWSRTPGALVGQQCTGHNDGVGWRSTGVAGWPSGEEGHQISR